MQATEHRHQTIIDKMTLVQKCTLLQGDTAFKTKAFEDLGIPALEFSDGPHGLRKQAEGANHLGLGGSVRATCFPTAAAVANSWDPALGEVLGTALAEEAGASRVNVVLGPGLNIKRNPLCGRNFEYFSEDPYLAGKMAAGYVRGIQAKGLAACPKHFAVNSQELCRMSNDSIVDERTLREIYLTGFEIAVKEAQPKCIMTSYNRVNGEFANENEHLLQDILKKEWGFDGAIVTDWGGSNDHAKGVKCGSNFEMPAAGKDSVRQLLTAVKEGKLSERDIDMRVDEALQLIFDTDDALSRMDRSFDEEAHHKLAEKIAEESVVLLKNKDHILPLAADTRVAVIGDFAMTPRYQGAGSSLVNPTKLTLLSEIEETGLNVIGTAKGYERSGKASESLKEEAAKLAGKADVVLFFCGLTEDKESEGMDRTDMQISANQIDVLTAIRQVNKKVILVLQGGSSVEMPWIDEVQALVYGCLGGQAAMSAVMKVLTGKVNPSGKLAETFAMRLKDNPSYRYYPGKKRTSEYREGIFVGYRYYDTAGKEVRFPFGYGLSYTKFAYSAPVWGKEGVSLTVTNIGKADGAEIVQMYVHKENSAVFRPEKELKGFTKVFLKAGESKQIMIPFDEYTFRFYDTAQNKWCVEGGEWSVMIGASSADIRLTGSVAVEGETITDPYEGAEIDEYRKGKVTKVSDEAFAAVLGHSIPDDKIVIDRNITFNQLNHGRSPLFWLVWLVMTVIKKRADRSGVPNLNLLFIYNMPLRGLQKMTGGMFSMGMVDALVMEVKGFWVIGLLRFLFEFILHLGRKVK